MKLNKFFKLKAWEYVVVIIIIIIEIVIMEI